MREIIKPIAVLGAICLVVTALLAFINAVTSPIIAEADAKAAAQARQEVLAEADAFEEITDAVKPDGVTEMYRAQNGAGYVFKLSTKGYGGTIELMCGVKADGSIESIQTLNHSETSGIGSKVVDNASGYSNNYTGKTADNYAEVDAVTGATISSKAYKKAVAAAFEAYQTVKEAGV